MHFTTVPSGAMEHQSGPLQIGQGALLVARIQLSLALTVGTPTNRYQARYDETLDRLLPDIATAVERPGMTSAGGVSPWSATAPHRGYLRPFLLACRTSQLRRSGQ